MVPSTWAGRHSPAPGGRGRSLRSRCRRWSSLLRSIRQDRSSHSGSRSVQGNTCTSRPPGYTDHPPDSSRSGHSPARMFPESKECHRGLLSIPRDTGTLQSRGDSLLSCRGRPSCSLGRSDLEGRAPCSSTLASQDCSDRLQWRDGRSQRCCRWDRPVHSPVRRIPADTCPGTWYRCTPGDTCRPRSPGDRSLREVHSHTGDCSPGPRSPPHRWSHRPPPSSRACTGTPPSRGHSPGCWLHTRTRAGSAGRNSRGSRSSHRELPCSREHRHSLLSPARSGPPGRSSSPGSSPRRSPEDRARHSRSRSTLRDRSTSLTLGHSPTRSHTDTAGHTPPRDSRQDRPPRTSLLSSLDRSHTTQSPRYTPRHSHNYRSPHSPLPTCNGNALHYSTSTVQCSPHLYSPQGRWQ